MINVLLIIFGKLVSKFSNTFNFGSGSTWPGHIALESNPNFIRDLLKNSNLKVILVVGTNGKTTTSRILATVLRENNLRVFQNNSGANLLNGIASSLLLHSDVGGKINYDFAIFEVDENTLPQALEQIIPKAVIVLDLFRDQLDRYGELDSVAKKWKLSLEKLSHYKQDYSTLILNADDPLVADLSRNVDIKTRFFGLGNSNSKNKIEDSADSIYCPRCKTKLNYSSIFYSHLGIWKCPNCKLQRPQPDLSESVFPLPGTYNKYNTLAAVLTAQILNVDHKTIDIALHKVTPAFGRQEKLNINGKNIQIFLSKNPTSMNESLQTVLLEDKNPNILFVLNDQIPDGRDISWIWDINFELFAKKFKTVFVSGDRAYDLSLRLAYCEIKNIQTFENLEEAVSTSLKKTNKTLYILPTYSAMLNIRKILIGRKIL